MIPLVLAAVVAAGGEPQTPTLAGVTLGSNLTQVLSEHPGAQRSANGSGQRWVWRRRGGGTVAVTADDIGKITRVDFVADRGQQDNIDVPCVAAFFVQASHVNLEFALEKTACSAFNGASYGVPDGSVVEVRFAGPGDGQLIEATWYRPSEKNPSPVGHMDAVIDYLRPVLKGVAGAARVYYAAICSADTFGQPRLLFPAVNLEAPPQGATGMTAVRQIFRDDPHVTTTQDRSEMLRITIGSVSTAILQTRIPALTLNSYEQYSAPSAVLAIENAPEVYAARRSLHLGVPWGIRDIIVGGPVEGAPHLPRVMQNVTVDEALDSVARTFKGIVMYGVCTQPDGKGLFELGFAYGS